ncbi:WecB/TagA/CpsF family glycosyltransferase [Haliea atlantica]
MADPRLQGKAVRTFAGCGIQPETQAELLAQLLPRLQAGERRLLVGHHNLHSLYLCQRDTRVHDFYRQCCRCYVDGVPVLWLLRGAGLDLRGASRFSFMDSLPALFDQAQSLGVRVFYLGSAPEVVARAERWVAREWPQLAAGFHHGYFDSRGEAGDSRAVIDTINAFRPDLLLVGMGMPRQEAWVLAHRQALDAGAILQAGGTLDYYTGAQARPPERWSRLGFGWLYRLLHDPRRLWRRYLVTPWALLGPWWRLRRDLRRVAPGTD